jgi:small subunit ribosomal protein S6
MRNYEIMLAMRGSLNSAEAKTSYDAFVSQLKKNKATVNYEEDWGKMNTAYKIKHETEAYYFVIQFSASTEIIKDMELFMELDKNIIRYITTKTEENPTPFTKAMHEEAKEAYYEAREQRKRKAQPKTRSTTAAQLKEDLQKSKNTDKKIDEILEKDLSL